MEAQMSPPPSEPEGPSSSSRILRMLRGGPSPGGSVDSSAEAEARAAESKLLQKLRNISAEVQDLRSVLQRIRKGEVPLARFKDYILMTCTQIDGLIDSIESEDDCIRHVHNAWEQMKTCRLVREPGLEFKPEDQMRLLTLLDEQCRRIIYWTGYRTIPDRLKSWLIYMKPGYALPFHSLFEDEMPDAEDRQKVLNQLAWTPGFLDKHGGIVDPESGLVFCYHYHDRVVRRFMALAWVLIAVLFATAGVWAVTQMPPLEALDPRVQARNTAIVLQAWGALVVGTLVHIAVGAAKRMREQGANGTVLPVSRFLIMLNARLGFVLIKVFMALIGLFALVYTSNLKDFTEDVSPLLFNAFLVGYSLDSVIELFGAGMDQRAGAHQAMLKKQLGGG